ncbi:MAG: type II toxin-antitoxin system VapC family toxin [Thermoleophilia bacterium]|nr:type II toxin-antitoxin system VapC family toxin [Thermoleophilia bacterium]
MGDTVLVDSDILIDHLRGYRSIDQRVMTAWAYSIVARVELFGGTDQEGRVRELLAEGVELGVSREVAERAGKLKRACGVALPDAIIAATALVNGLLLVTRNAKHYKRIPELRIEVPNDR